MPNWTAVGVFMVAALLEVGGDAAIRRYRQGGAWPSLAVGFLALCSYGYFVNTQKRIDFSQLLGAYVAAFALVAVAWGSLINEDHISKSTWVGLIVILVGGAIIQWGDSLTGQ